MKDEIVVHLGSYFQLYVLLICILFTLASSVKTIQCFFSYIDGGNEPASCKLISRMVPLDISSSLPRNMHSVFDR